MKSSIVAATAIFVTAALAQPQHGHHRRHNHHAAHQKRDIVWVTETDIVTEYLDITSTVWIDGDATSAPVTTPSSAPQQPAQFFEPAADPTTSSSSVRSTTLSSVYVAPAAPKPTTTSVYVAPPAPEPTTIISYVEPVVPIPVPAPAPTSTSVPPVVVPVTTAQPAPAYVEPAPAPIVVQPTTQAAAPVIQAAVAPAPAVATTAASSSSSSSSGGCSSGSPCSGDITFYDTGLGACGWENDGVTEAVVALPVGLMGAQSNGNPYCGKMVTVSYKGKTTVAKVVDKCMGCQGKSIDLSHAAFGALADEALGRTTAEWWFN